MNPVMTAKSTRADYAIRTASSLEWPMRFAALAAVTVWLYAICWSTEPPDMRIFLLPWYEHIVQTGRIAAFSEPFSNYTPPYLYLLSAASLADGMVAPMSLIKLLSVAGTIFLALAVAELVKSLGGDPKRAGTTLILPTVVINAALLGQCDALWAGACVLAVAAMVRGATLASLVWCGVAIAFKAQAAFVAPFIIGVLIGRRAPLWQWLVPGIVFIALMTPAWLLGWPAGDLATIYVRQVEHFDYPGNLANPWMWATVFARRTAQDYYLIGYAAAAASALLIGAASARLIRNPRALASMALLSAFALPYLLPKMHERYLFLADVLALAIALARRDRACFQIALAVQLTSLLAMLSYMYDWPVPALIGSVLGAVALGLILRAIWADPARRSPPRSSQLIGRLAAHRALIR